jgi:hypothetical protein
MGQGTAACRPSLFNAQAGTDHQTEVALCTLLLVDTAAHAAQVLLLFSAPLER